jgi:SAM-dependent methyltransferase
MDIPQGSDRWEPYLAAVATRFNREAGIQLGEPDWQLPEDLKSLPFWQDCHQHHLMDRLGVPFHQLRAPKKKEHCLDLGCGVSFLIYPWSHWDAAFYGHELSNRIVKFIQSRAPQLNSKLFKSMQQGVAHQLDHYREDQFDLAIATGFLYYYPVEYFTDLWQPLQRVLKPKSPVILEVIDPESPWTEEWGLIEIFKGTEPIFTPRQTWETVFKQLGARILQQADGELFTTYVIQ